jgi:hypothetical protein
MATRCRCPPDNCPGYRCRKVDDDLVDVGLPYGVQVMVVALDLLQHQVLPRLVLADPVRTGGGEILPELERVPEVAGRHLLGEWGHEVHREDIQEVVGLRGRANDQSPVVRRGDTRDLMGVDEGFGRGEIPGGHLREFRAVLGEPDERRLEVVDRGDLFVRITEAFDRIDEVAGDDLPGRGAGVGDAVPQVEGVGGAVGTHLPRLGQIGSRPGIVAEFAGGAREGDQLAGDRALHRPGVRIVAGERVERIHVGGKRCHPQVPPPVISPVSDPRFIGALPEHAVRRMVAAARAAVPRP